MKFFILGFVDKRRREIFDVKPPFPSELRILLNEGKNITEIAKMYNVNRHTISNKIKRLNLK